MEGTNAPSFNVLPGLPVRLARRDHQGPLDPPGVGLWQIKDGTE